MAIRKMKPSGVEWLGEIPEEWKISNISGLYTLRNQKVSDKDYPPLSVTKQGVLPQLDTVAKTNAHDDRKLVKKGDFAINSRSDRRGSCGVSQYDGSVSLINTVLKPREQMHSGYYDWLFHTTQFADEFYKNGHGIVDDLWTTNWQDMKKICVPAPTLSEQQFIADFLDKKCGEIDGLIFDLQAQIATLEQYRRSVITETVTRGLNPNAPMKDSGIEWIGKIPAHWECVRVKNAVDYIFKGNGITKEDVVENGDSPCVRYGEIYSKYNYMFDHCLTYTNKDKIASKKYFSYGDILFAGTGELIEEIGKNIVYLGNEKCLAGGDIIVVHHSQNPIFLTYVLNSDVAQYQKSRDKLKLKVVHISASEISNIFIPLPPIHEQQLVADFLKTKCSEIDSAITDKQAQIAMLEQYRKSLIFEYVTGKKEIAR